METLCELSRVVLLTASTATSAERAAGSGRLGLRGLEDSLLRVVRLESAQRAGEVGADRIARVGRAGWEDDRHSERLLRAGPEQRIGHRRALRAERDPLGGECGGHHGSERVRLVAVVVLALLE